MNLLAVFETSALPEVLLRALHIAAALAAAGGALFQWTALHPTLRTLDEPQRVALRETIVARWRPVVYAAIGLLLVTGLMNFMLYKVPELKTHPHKLAYHAIFGVKFLAALAAFHGAAVLTLPGPKGEKYRANAGFWLKYLVMLFALIVICGALLYNFKRLFGAQAG